MYGCLFGSTARCAAPFTAFRCHVGTSVPALLAVTSYVRRVACIPVRFVTCGLRHGCLYLRIGEFAALHALGYECSGFSEDTGSWRYILWAMRRSGFSALHVLEYEGSCSYGISGLGLPSFTVLRTLRLAHGVTRPSAPGSMEALVHGAHCVPRSFSACFRRCALRAQSSLGPATHSSTLPSHERAGRRPTLLPYSFAEVQRGWLVNALEAERAGTVWRSRSSDHVVPSPPLWLPLAPAIQPFCLADFRLPCRRTQLLASLSGHRSYELF